VDAAIEAAKEKEYDAKDGAQAATDCGKLSGK